MEERVAARAAPSRTRRHKDTPRAHSAEHPFFFNLAPASSDSICLPLTPPRTFQLRSFAFWKTLKCDDPLRAAPSLVQPLLSTTFLHRHGSRTLPVRIGGLTPQLHDGSETLRNNLRLRHGRPSKTPLRLNHYATATGSQTNTLHRESHIPMASGQPLGSEDRALA